MPRGVYFRTEEHRKILSKVAKKYGFVPPSRKGVPSSPESRLKISIKNKGRKHTAEHIKKRIESRRISDDARGRKTNYIRRLRMCKEYILWRRSVFERDNYTCIWCGKIGGRLNADHIKPFSQYPALRFAIDNGRTLCEPCHMKTDTFGHKSIKKKQ